MPKQHPDQYFLAHALCELLGIPPFCSMKLEWKQGEDWPTVEVMVEVKPYVIIGDELKQELRKFRIVPVE